MPNSKMVSYRNGSFIVVKASEDVDVLGNLTFTGSNDFSAASASVVLDSSGITIDSGLIANLNADLLDGAQKLTVIDDSDGGDDANIPTEKAVIDYVTAGILVETNARIAADDALQAELDATQTGAGLGLGGSYTAHAGANFIQGATSLHNADLILDAQVQAISTAQTSGIQWKASVTDLAALETAVAADTSAQDGDAYFVRSENDIYVLQTTGLGTATGDYEDANNEKYVVMVDLSEITGLIDAIESAVGLEADSTYVAIAAGTHHTASAKTSLKEDFAHVSSEFDAQIEVNRAGLAQEIIDRVADVDAEEARAIGVEGNIQSELDATQTGAGLANDGAYVAANPANYIGSAGSLFAADVALDAQAKANADAILLEITNRTSADTAIQNELNATQTGAGLSATGTYTANGSTTHITSATSLKNADDLLDGALVAEIARASGVEANIQSELDVTQTGAGLNGDGTYSANTGANYIAAASDLQDADDKLDAALKIEELARIAADSAEATTRANADTALQNELDATQTGAGLDASGGYVAVVARDFIGAATSLDDADAKLAAALKLEETARVAADSLEATTRTNADAAIQAHVDAHEVSTGMNADGSFSAYSGTDYIDAASTMKAADILLDTQVKVNADAIANFITQVGSAFEFVGTIDPAAAVGSSFNISGLTQTSAGDYYQIVSDGEVTDGTNVMAVHQGDAIVFDSNGDPQKFDNTDPSVVGTAAFVSVSYDGATETYSVDLDAAFKTRMTDAESDIVALQSELDATQTGAGLASDGAYVAANPANYIGSAVSLFAADVALDAALKSEETARIGADTTLQANIDAEAVLRTNADAALQTELDAVETAAGLNADGSFNAHTGSNYINAATTMKGVDSALDGAIKSVSDALNATTLEVADNAGNSDAVNLISDDLKLINGSNIAIALNRTGTDVQFTVETQQEVVFQSVKAEYKTVSLSAGAALSVGSLLHISANSSVDVADNSSEFESRVMGVALNGAAAAGNSVDIAISGQILPVDTSSIGGTVAAMIAGAPLYLDTSGGMTTTVPVGDGTSGNATLAVIVKVGYVVDATSGVNGQGEPNGKFFFHPQVIAISE